jgi:hypothetical protein
MLLEVHATTANHVGTMQEVVPGLVELEVAVPYLSPAVR